MIQEIKKDNFEFIDPGIIVTVPEAYDPLVLVNKIEYKQYRFDTYDSVFIYTNRFHSDTTKLVPGRSFKVKFLKINTYLEYEEEEYLRLLRAQRANFVGIQGLVLLYEQQKDKIPINKRVFSFFPNEDWCGRIRETEYGAIITRSLISYVEHYWDGSFGIGVKYFSLDFFFGNYYLCFI